MLSFFLWYLIVTLLGFLAFPLAYRAFSGLAGRGYAFSRVLGLLVWGYLFWLLGSLGFLRNDLGGQLLALGLLAAVSFWGLQGSKRAEMRAWLRVNRSHILSVEILFLVSFGLLAFIRAANPEIVGTEKPMELAFINAILRSPSLPPNDPWLSGYSISYYYFGYVLVALLARLAGTFGGVAFNLGVALVFSLTALGAYGVLFNLLARPRMAESTPEIRKNSAQALLAPFFVLIVSNMGGFLHLLRHWGVFWTTAPGGEKVSKIWSWLDMGRYASPPTGELFSHWWWWQASRIVQDFDFNGANKGDIINEFPFFSFLLGDLHPHVLAMPFAILALGLALNLFFGGAKGTFRWVWFRFAISPQAFGLAALVLGSLAFFNTWDFPFYVAIFAGAYLLRQMQIFQTARRFSLWEMLKALLELGFALGVSGILLYLPFYFGFQSQAGGPLPNVIYVTRGVYLWIQFIPFLVPIFGLLIALWRRGGAANRLKDGLKLTGGLILGLLALSWLLVFLISILGVFRNINPDAAIAGDAFLGSQAAPGWWPLLLEGLRRRLTVPGTLLTLFAILSLGLALLWPRRPEEADPPQNESQIFVLLLILVGALLVLAPEFVFLRDLFGYRINTIFKFYFQVWLMWGIAAAYAVIWLGRHLSGAGRFGFQAALLVILTLSLTYPVMGIWSRANGFANPAGFTLDGTAHIAQNSPDEKAAMDWLRHAPLGPVAEAVGGSYTQFARMAVNSGQPAVLGWDFHEMQWRGGTAEMGSRRADIERLYCTADWDQARQVLTQYNIRYVVLGPVEQSAYGRGSQACPAGLMEGKFTRYLTPVFIQGGVMIYDVPGWRSVGD